MTVLLFAWLAQRVLALRCSMLSIGVPDVADSVSKGEVLLQLRQRPRTQLTQRAGYLLCIEPRPRPIAGSSSCSSVLEQMK